eukprot:603499_1
MSRVRTCCWICLLVHVIYGRPSVGIIRWDAWNKVSGYYDEISFYVQNDMSPSQFHYRLPFFASTSPNVSFDNNNQTIMDQEILYAHNAGIDYWAFDTYCKYGPNCSTTSKYCAQYANQSQCCKYCPEDPAYGLNKYLSSKYKHLINFTLVLLGSMPCDPANIDYYVSLMKQDTFQTVNINNTVRPLIYLFLFNDNEAEICGGWQASKQSFDNIRSAAMNAGLNNPYFVYMSGGVQIAYQHSSLLGFDAISSYAIGCGGNSPQCSSNGSDFSYLMDQNEKWWMTAYNDLYSVSKLGLIFKLVGIHGQDIKILHLGSVKVLGIINNQVQWNYNSLCKVHLILHVAIEILCRVKR